MLPGRSVHTGASPRALLAAAGALALMLGCGVVSAADAPTEPQVKAAYIYNFAKFVQWPPEAFATPKAPLVLCVTGKQGLGGALTAIEGKPVQGRELQVRRAVKPEEFKACHMLFVPEADERAAPELLRKVGALPVLTIGEHDGFAAAGGGIGFVTRDDRVQFEINPDVASRANLTVSSQLLRLATIVHDKRSPP